MKHLMKATSWALVCLMVLGTLTAVLLPVVRFTSAAANGVALPDDAMPYDGTPSTALSGTGTETDPFIIASTADFVYFYESLAATATADQHFKLTGDVYWNAKDSTKYTVSSKDFAGVLDGNGHTVYNAYRGGDNYSATAVFGTVTGAIKNLVFDGTEINVLNGNAAGVCLTLDGGTIDNVHLKNAKLNGQNVGGIVNSLRGGAIVSDCSVEGTLARSSKTAANKTGSIGGIVNSIPDGATGTIQGCVNRASLGGDKTTAFGGIIACSATDNPAIEALTIRNCQNYGEIVAAQENASVGGIIGYAYRIKNLTIENCTNYAAITGTGSTGGILGAAKWGTSNSGVGIVIQNCCNQGVIISSGDNVGGIVGNHEDVKKDIKMTGCAGYADVTGVNNVGGILGRNYSGDWQEQKALVVNSAVYGNVTATGNYAGMLAGNHVACYNTGEISATNCVLTGTVTANEGAGGFVGFIGYRQAKGMTSNVKLINSFADITVKVPEGANAATVVGGAQSGVTGIKLATTDSGVSVKVYVGDTAVEAPAAYYTYPADGALTVSTAELPVLATGAMTDSTVKNLLNTYAAANSLGSWTQGATAPILMTFYEWPARFTNQSELSHAYNGEAVAAITEIVSQSVARVEVFYYLASDTGRTAPLSGAPAAVGAYVAVLRVYDAEGNELESENDFSTSFEITKAKTKIVLDLSKYEKREDGTYTIEYSGELANPAVDLVSLATGGSITGVSVLGSSLKDGVSMSPIDPGVYVITFTFGGDDNYEAAESVSVTVEITKHKIAYPENIWTANGTDALADNAKLPYNGREQTIRLLGVDTSIFAVDYRNHTATNASDAMTATATVSLNADQAAYYELVGTAPTYEWTWTVTKATVKVILLRTSGDASTKVELTDCEYSGSTETYYAVFADAEGNIVFTPENNEIIVSGAGIVERTFTWAGDTNYEAADETVSFAVTPKNLGENGGSHADMNRTYDGSKTTFSPDFGTAPSGTAWSAVYETLIERKNGDAYEKVEEALRGGEYRVTFTALTEDGNYRASFTVTFTIARAAATITPPATGWGKDGEIFTITYDGKEYAFKAMTNSDGTLNVTYDCDGKTNLPKIVGTYTVTVAVAATDNYTEASATYTVRVDKMIIPTVPEGTELWDYAGAFTYDEAEKRVTVKEAFLAQYGIYLDLRYEDNVKTAAGDYTARVTFSLKDTKNTRFEGTDGTDIVRTLTWKVNKRVLSVDGVTLPDASGIYTGNTVTTTVELPAALTGKVNVRYEWKRNGVAYTGDAVDAGVYTVIAILTPKDASSEFAGGETEYRTDAATVEILQNTAAITGEKDFTVKYDGTVTDPLSKLKLVGSDNTAFDAAAYLTVTMTKDGQAVTEIRDAGVYRIIVSVRDEDGNITAAEVTRTVTVERATYEVDGKITVVGDTIYVAGKAGDITLRVDVKGSDGVAVTVDESRLPKLPNTPGTHTLTYYLKGSDNYEPLAAFTVEVTVKQATAKDNRRSDASVIFEDGADPDVRLTVEENPVDEDVKNLMEGCTFGQKIAHPAIRQLYRYTFKDKDGNALAYSDFGGVSVVIILPEKYRGYTREALFDEISVISVTYNKGIAAKMTVENPGNVVYDAEAGTLTIKAAGPDVAYGYVAEASPVAAYITIGVSGAALIAVIVLAVVRAVGASRRTRPEGPDTTDAADAGYGYDHGYGDGTEDAYAADTTAYDADETPVSYGDAEVTEEEPLAETADEAAYEEVADEEPVTETSDAERPEETPEEVSPAEEMPVPDEMPIPDEDAPHDGEA